MWREMEDPRINWGQRQPRTKATAILLLRSSDGGNPKHRRTHIKPSSAISSPQATSAWRWTETLVPLAHILFLCYSGSAECLWKLSSIATRALYRRPLWLKDLALSAHKPESSYRSSIKPGKKNSVNVAREIFKADAEVVIFRSISYCFDGKHRTSTVNKEGLALTPLDSVRPWWRGGMCANDSGGRSLSLLAQLWSVGSRDRRASGTSL